MKQVLHLLIFCGIFFLTTRSTASYVRTPLSNNNGSPIAWNLSNPGTPIVSGGRITYSLNPAGSDDLSFAQLERAIAASFQSWEDIPTSNVAFIRGSNSTSTTTTGDNVLQLFWLENSESTGDGLNLAGAVALTRRTFFTGGARTGEITDAATVFNGFRYKWAVDGRSDAVDVQEVATHEIGHILGLAHTPIGGATMYPLTIAGRTQARTLAPDDSIAASIAYPAPGFLNSTGTIRGRISSGGANVFGAHVVAVDGNGNVMTSALSQPDGNYSMQGLPPGSYTVYAEPLDPITGAYFSRANLEGFYANANVNFSTTQDFQLNVTAGGTTTLDIPVVSGAPSFDGYLVRGPESTFFFNLGAQIVQGQVGATIGVGGANLPQSGTPLTISGSGVTINRTFFTSFDGLPAVMAEITVSPSALTGSRNIIISSGQQRTIMTGALEIAPATAATVSSANFTAKVAAESLASVFGQNLAATTVSATTKPLPTSLGGTTVRLRDNSGQELLAPLFFASPTQINFQIAPGLLPGTMLVKVGNNESFVSTGSLFLESVAPGLFSASGNGQGLAAAVALRIKPNGQQIFEPVSRFDQPSGQIVPVPVDLNITADQVFLVLFGTGVRFRSSLSACSYNIGGLTGTPLYVGLQGDFVGLDQINLPLSQGLSGRGPVNVSLIIDGKTSNTLTVSIK
ncbi:MAG: matrixin family metalloprotease [Blastocatellales bacterium]